MKADKVLELMKESDFVALRWMEPPREVGPEPIEISNAKPAFVFSSLDLKCFGFFHLREGQVNNLQLVCVVAGPWDIGQVNAMNERCRFIKPYVYSATNNLHIEMDVLVPDVPTVGFVRTIREAWDANLANLIAMA